MSDEPKILNIILAHHRMDNLVKLCSNLSGHPHVYTIVHVDKKFKVILPKLPENCNYTSKRISCHHDSFSLIDVVFVSYQSAVQQFFISFDYINLLSGEDIALRDTHCFYQFITKVDRSFLNYEKMPAEKSTYHGGKFNSNFARYLKNLTWSPQYYYDRLYPRQFSDESVEKGMYKYNYFHFPKIRSFLRKQKLNKYATYNRIIRWKLKKPLPKISFYSGSEWFTLKKNHFEFCLQQYLSKNWLNFVFKTSLFAGEYYFQTVLLNQFDQAEFINSDLRYVNWDKAVNGRPQELTKSEMDKALKSNAFFARKAPQWESQ